MRYLLLTREVPAKSLKIEHVILVRPSDRISADGIILGGDSGINEALVTGESVPKRKKTGDTVFAGTGVNGVSALHVSVTAGAADKAIARGVRLGRGGAGKESRDRTVY